MEIQGPVPGPYLGLVTSSQSLGSSCSQAVGLLLRYFHKSMVRREWMLVSTKASMPEQMTPNIGPVDLVLTLICLGPYLLEEVMA